MRRELMDLPDSINRGHADSLRLGQVAATPVSGSRRLRLECRILNSLDTLRSKRRLVSTVLGHFP